jgi:nicotinate-nucleotide adenylyltransferase
LRLATICVAARADPNDAGAEFVLEKVPGFGFQRLPMPSLPVSATDIRTRIAAHLSVADMVFEPVARYIALHHLYQTP